MLIDFNEYEREELMRKINVIFDFKCISNLGYDYSNANIITSTYSEEEIYQIDIIEALSNSFDPVIGEGFVDLIYNHYDYLKSYINIPYDNDVPAKTKQEDREIKGFFIKFENRCIDKYIKNYGIEGIKDKIKNFFYYCDSTSTIDNCQCFYDKTINSFFLVYPDTEYVIYEECYSEIIYLIKHVHEKVDDDICCL